MILLSVSNKKQTERYVETFFFSSFWYVAKRREREREEKKSFQ
jgi:hypothetical protein